MKRIWMIIAWSLIFGWMSWWSNVAKQRSGFLPPSAVRQTIFRSGKIPLSENLALLFVCSDHSRLDHLDTRLHLLVRCKLLYWNPSRLYVITRDLSITLNHIILSMQHKATNAANKQIYTGNNWTYLRNKLTNSLHHDPRQNIIRLQTAKALQKCVVYTES